MLSKRKFVFVKRTIEDVELLCTGGDSNVQADFSPFKSINKFYKSNVRAIMIKKPVAGFYECDEEDNPKGLPIGYIIPLSVVKKVKGFDLSECEWLIFDEFIPEPWERVSRKEGDQLLELYMTVSRARELQGKPPLILICLANAVEISNPVMNTLEVTDTFATMNATRSSVVYDERRYILCRMLNDNDAFQEKQKQTKIYQAMSNTAWGQMAFENQFAYNDFTNVGRLNLKGFKPVTSLTYKHKNYYIYQKDGQYYMTYSKYGILPTKYNLATENHQKKFYIDYAIDLRNECIDGNMLFECYSMYDLIVNYKQFFKL